MLNQKNLIIGILVFLILFSFLYYFVFSEKTEKISNVKEVEKILEMSDCGDIRERINQEIEEQNYCESKADCILLNSCAYGCNKLINKNADMSKMVGLESVFLKNCGNTCGTACRGALKSDQIACEKNKCESLKK